MAVTVQKIRGVRLSYLPFFLNVVRGLPYRLLSSNSLQKEGGKIVRRQPVLIIGKGKVVVGEKVVVGVYPSPHFFSSYAHIEARTETSTINIGPGTHINNNFTVIAEHSSISIGKDCLIGANVEIVDSDFHGLHPDHRHLSLREWTKPVSVGNRVFIGSNVRILKGTIIGDDSVVANGSVVSGEIPSRVIAGGNPCRTIRSFD